MFSLFAVLEGGILGTVRNKVGNVVAATWFGINYVRSYVVPSNPNTAAQQTQRTFFAAIVAAAKLILTTVIQPYWDPFYTQYSGYNAFCKKNLDDMSAPFDYADMSISQGNLELDEITGAPYAASAVTIAWSVAGMGDGLGSDHAVGVVFDSANNIAFVADNEDARADEECAVTVGAGRTAANLKAYLFFKRGSGETLYVSNSDYFQVTT